MEAAAGQLSGYLSFCVAQVFKSEDSNYLLLLADMVLKRSTVYSLLHLQRSAMQRI